MEGAAGGIRAGFRAVQGVAAEAVLPFIDGRGRLFGRTEIEEIPCGDDGGSGIGEAVILHAVQNDGGHADAGGIGNL